jgi:ketosteroid isomerase-like protein
MRLRPAITALSTALLIAFSTSLAVAADVEDQVKKAYAAWDAAFNKGDPKAIAAFYTSKSYLLPPSHQVIEGPAGVEKFFAGLFSAGVKDHKLEMIEARGNKKIVYGAAKWSATGKDDKGQPSKVGGTATHVFEKQPDGSLKLSLHTFN